MTECSPLLRIFVCSTLFPLCSLTEVILPCRDVCFSAHAACHHAYLLHRQEWSTFFNCTNLPARPQVCLFPPSTTSSFKLVTIVFASVCYFTLVYLFISMVNVTSFKSVTIVFASICYFILVYLLIYIANVTSFKSVIVVFAFV